MIHELSPATRQRIIDEAHRQGYYAATHGGVQMEVERYQIPNTGKFGVSLKVCLDRKWKTFTEETVFAAVETFNRILEERAHRREVKQPDLWGGANNPWRIAA